MSSPFKVFRKYSGPLMVALCVLAMFAFVVADPLMQYLGGAAGRGQNQGGFNPTDTAVRWDGGALTNRELSSLVSRRYILKGFLEQLFRMGQGAAIEAGADPSQPLRVRLVAGIGQPTTNIERQVLQTRILADQARKQGMAISDEAVRRYLTEVGRQRVSADQMRQLLANPQFGGGRVPIDYLFEALKEELLAQNFFVSYQFAFNSVTPQQRWNDWLRVNDRVVVEAAALPAKEFVIDVPEPSGAELEEFFAEYREREVIPSVVDNTELPSPTPGFATPRRVKVHYLAADYNNFLTKVSEEVTEEEIAKFYEENKEMFIRADSGFDTDALFEEAADDFEFEVDEPPMESDTEQPVSENNNETAPSSDSGETSDAAPDETPKEESSETDDSKTANQSAEPNTEEEEEQEETVIRGQDSEEAESSDPTTDEADSESSTPGEEVENTESEEKESTPDDTSKAADRAPEEESETSDKKVEYQPLEEVSEEIRLQIARDKATEQLVELMDKLYGQLKSAHTSWESKVFDAEDVGKEPPAPPEILSDFSGLAEEYGLDYQKTGLLSRLELRDTPIGNSRNPSQFGQAPLWLAMFVELKKFQPAVTFDLEGNRYLSLKVEDEPASIPELDEVRDEVIRVYKLQKASELALKRAEELATEAQQSGLPLKEAFASDSRVTVETTDPFSWLTIGNISPTTRQVFFRMSEPAGVVAAGPAFMREVFNQEPGKVGAVLNHDHSIAYVVRVVEHLESEQSLREAFISEADRWYGLPSMMRFHDNQAMQAWIGDLVATMGVEWMRPPDEPPETEEAG